MADRLSPPLYTEDEDGFGAGENDQYKFKQVKKNINEVTEDYDSCKNQDNGRGRNDNQNHSLR